LTFFFMPETAFKRSSSLNIDTSAHNVSNETCLETGPVRS
jgi:hypothetical protein